MKKSEIRRPMYKLLRESYFPGKEEVKETIEKHPKYKEADVLLAFWPLSNEIDTTALFKEKTVYLPVCTEDSMYFALCDGSLSAHANKTLIPEDTTQVFAPAANTKCLVLVPGVAFTKDGKRMGRGGGFYDRFLKEIENDSRFYRIGVCLKCQILEDIPTKEHDMCVDEVIAF